MSENKLILHSINPEWIFDLEMFVAQLQGIEFLEKEVRREQSDYKELVSNSIFYKPGAKFFDLVIFAHSHPVGHLEFINGNLQETEVFDSRELCEISIEFRNHCVFLGGGNTDSAACPNCQYEVADWSALVGEWWNNKSGFSWTCTQCGKVSKIHELNWYQQNGFGRCSIDIWEVRFGEAKPSNELLDSLRNITGEQWTYFYYRL